LYAQNQHQHISEEMAKELAEQTGGWITGMVLSNLNDVRIAGVDTFSYLGHQVLDLQPDHVREFLLRTSLPEEFNVEFCEYVLTPLYASRGPQNWLALMGLILEKNLFVLPLGDDGRWLRYHPLFREFLQLRLKEEHPNEIRPMLERMVKSYEQAGEWEQAYYTCKQLNDPEALADVVEHAGTAMLQSALVTLEGWINSLPPSMVLKRPGLISLRGPMLAMKGNLVESRQLLDTAISIYKKKRDIGGLTLAFTRRAHTHRLLGDYHASLADTKEAMRLAESNLVYQPLYAEALRIKGLDLYRLGESRQAIEALGHSLSLYTALNETGSIPTVLMETGMVHIAVGNVSSAKISYQEALRIWQSEKNLYSQAEILNNLAVLYYQLGEYELASETFERGLVCARKSRNQRAESLILTGLGDLYGEIEEFEAALLAYQQAEMIANVLPGSFISNYLVMAKGMLALLKMDLNTSSKILAMHKRKLKSSQSTYERGLWALFEGRFNLLMDESQKAIRSFKECKNYFMQDGRDLEIHWSMIWLSSAYYQAGQKDDARSEMNELLTGTVGQEHALLITFLQADAWLSDLQNDAQIGRQLGSWLEKSRLLAMKLPAIRRALRHHAQSIQIPAASLVIRAFGRAEVSVNGRSIAMSDWRTQSVRDLFFYFLFKFEAVTKEQIAEVLWPEVDNPQILKARFKNEIYRLRRAIGRDVVIFDEEYYRFNRAMDYTYDVETFDSHLSRARKAVDKMERTEHFQKAVDIAQGPYLSDVAGAWTHIERERLGQAYISALEELAKLYLDENRVEQCLSVCQLALKQDQYNESIYQIEMRAYAVLGDRISIARQYQACKTTLQEGLGLLPSRETEQIYRELLG